MNAVEDRLTQALAARANLVRPEDLTPVDVPEVRRPRATPYLLAAAAVAAVVTVPLLVLGLGDDEAGPADPSPAPSPSPTVEDGRGANWPVFERRSHDLDGDGTKEQVRLRAPDPNGAAGPLRVETNLSSGGPTHVLLEGDMLGATLVGARDMDADGDLELLLHREFISEGAGRAVTVLTLEDGALVETTAPDQPRISDALDTQLRGRGWWWRGGVLHSYRSTEPFDSDGHDVTFPEEFRAQVWSWTLSGTELSAGPVGEWCVGGSDSGNPVPCDADASIGEAFFPLVDSVIGPGESFQVDLDGSGEDTVSLETEQGEAVLGEVEEGEVDLVVRFHDGRAMRVPLPAGAFPLVSTMPVTLGDDRGILVRQEGGDSTATRVYAVRDGELVEVPTVGDVPLRTSFDEQAEVAVSHWTWQSVAGHLYTARQVEDEESATVWEWSFTGEELEAEPRGAWCIDRDVSRPSARPC